MTTPQDHRRAFLRLLLAACALPVSAVARQEKPGASAAAIRDGRSPGHHVYPKGRIQDALEAAARDPVNKTVYVHAGTYRPAATGQALIWFNARHDGITLEAVGDVILTAANPDVADRQAPQLSRGRQPRRLFRRRRVAPKTVLRGFKITGANNFTTGSGEKSPIESDDIRKTLFFYADGGGIKIYARSYPTIEHVEVYGNYASPCGGGVSVEHLDQMQDSVLFRHCIFRNNRTQITGSALDLLHGSRATIENCLFVGNVANMGVDYVGLLTGGEYHPEHGSGAMTVFEGSRATVSQQHVHRQLERRRRQRRRQHLRRLDLLEQHAGGRHLAGRRATSSTSPTPPACAARSSHGEINDLRGTIDRQARTRSIRRIRGSTRAVPPQAPQYAGVGYRPVRLRRLTAPKPRHGSC